MRFGLFVGRAEFIQGNKRFISCGGSHRLLVFELIFFVDLFEFRLEPIEVFNLVLQQSSLVLWPLGHSAQTGVALTLRFKLTHLVVTVDYLRCLCLLVENLDCGDIAAIGAVLLKLNLVVNQEVHEPFLFLWRQQTEHECLHCFIFGFVGANRTDAARLLFSALKGLVPGSHLLLVDVVEHFGF